MPAEKAEGTAKYTKYAKRDSFRPLLECGFAGSRRGDGTRPDSTQQWRGITSPAVNPPRPLTGNLKAPINHTNFLGMTVSLPLSRPRPSRIRRANHWPGRRPGWW